MKLISPSYLQGGIQDINEFLYKMPEIRCSHNLYSVFYTGLQNNSDYGCDAGKQTGEELMQRVKTMGANDFMNLLKGERSTKKGKAFSVKEKANELHRSGNFEEAVELYTKAMTLSAQESVNRK